MARVQAFVAVRAPLEEVRALVLDLSRRHLFLPDGWRRLRLLTEQATGAGASMEVEASLGPRPTTGVVEVLDATDRQVLEGPPTRENLLTTWTFGRDEAADETLVGVLVEFEYGGPVGEWFVRRRLRRALRQQLDRLKLTAEGGRES